jgi:CubicO group peptidase (beta-lactamase class C family)
VVLVWSATKGPSSACLLDALARAGVSPDVPVAELWPEFGVNGKAAVTVAQVLAHRSGICAVADRSLSAFDHEAVAACLAAQPPAWPPGSAHGYSPRAFGYLVEELVRRVGGMGCGEYWARFFAEPLSLDFWIGLPEAEHPRAAQALPPRATESMGEKTPFAREMATPGSLTHAAFSAPGGVTGPSSMNSATSRSSCLPAFGGIGTARSLAGFYAALGEGSLLPPEIQSRLSQPVSSGLDLVLRRETAFSLGFMLDPVENRTKIRALFGTSLRAFGHPGAGGSLAFYDPEHRLAFAYVMNQMQPGALPRDRTRRLVAALYG